jgi:hypothetical protein
MVHDGGKSFEVEFVTQTGDTLGVLTLTADEVQPISARDVPHVRGGDDAGKNISK